MRFALLCGVSALAVSSTAGGAPLDDEPIVRAMKDETTRAMSTLDQPKPYFISYSVWDLATVRVRADLGALTSSIAAPRRSAAVDVRVGDYTLDNSNVADPEEEKRDYLPRRERHSFGLPVEADYNADRHALWVATDREYVRARRMLDLKKQALSNATTTGAEPPSFSTEVPSKIIETRTPALPEQTRLEVLAKSLSAVFRQNADVYEGSVEIASVTGRHYFTSSEGAASVQPVSFVRVHVSCQSRADDGTPVTDELDWWVTSFDQLPPVADMVTRVQDLSRELSNLRVAPVARPYAGPVLFEGVASGQVIRSLLVDNLRGTPPPKGEPAPGPSRRQRNRLIRDTELAEQVGKAILPADISIVDDPTISRVGNAVLVGAARFDSEGVPTLKTSLVEKGTLRAFLMSRTPRSGFLHSNGHAGSRRHRAEPSNLIVSSTAKVSDAELRKRGLALAKQQSLGFVLVVSKLEMNDLDRDGGDQRRLPAPLVVKRLYADGREELVRGAVFTAPISVRALTAVGSTPNIYSWGDGPSGSGSSIAAPSLLLTDLVVARSARAEDQAAPIVSRPAP